MDDHLTTLPDLGDSELADYIRIIESVDLFIKYGVTPVMYQVYVTSLQQCTCYTTEKTEKIWGKLHSSNCNTVKIFSHNTMSKTTNPTVLFKVINHLFQIAKSGKMDELKRTICSISVQYLQIYFRHKEEYNLYINDITRHYYIPGHGLADLSKAGLKKIAISLSLLIGQDLPN